MMTDEQIYALFRSIGFVTFPNGLTDYHRTCAEQLNWNMQHADYYFYGAGDGYVIVDMVDYQESVALEQHDWLKAVDDTQLERKPEHA